MNNQWRSHAERMVVWSNGEYDHARYCGTCAESHDAPSVCPMPTHGLVTADGDGYDITGKVHNADISDGSPYWRYMETESPLGHSVNGLGETIHREWFAANPDGMSEQDVRHSGVSEVQHEYLQEAFEQLSPMQQKVWQMVMREQVSQVDAAAELGVTFETVKTHLARAKAKVSSFLRQKQETLNDGEVA